MGNLGSASIQLNLDRSQFDRDLKKLQSTDAGSIAYCLKLDTKDFERQVKGLSAKISPIFIPLEIDTSRFDQQIKKLSANIDPIKIDLAPNVKDFQEKLKRIGRISPIEVEIKVDKARVLTQFTEIGKYASVGFTQGFSGAEGAGKAAVDSMVRSVKSQLGIQSPSRVFREIGKYAIAGLMQGFDSVDESKLKGVVNKIENYFKKSKVKISLDVDASNISGRIKVQAPISPTEKTGDFSKNIAKSIEEGFQKAKPKANFLGAIFGGLGSLIAIPLSGVLRGAFEGIGTPLGLQLGAGVTKAFQSTLGANIGSLELISQKAVEKSLQAIPAAQSAIVEVIKNNPIGGAVVKQLELLQKTLELYSINLSPQKAVKSLATDGERALASSSATFTNQETQFKASKKAKAAAANEFVSLVDGKGEVDKITQLIGQKEKDLVAKLKKIQAAQGAIASLEIQLQKLAQLPDKQRSLASAPIKGRIAELSQVLAGGSASIEQDIQSIAGLKKTKSAYLEKLNNQIKVLADLGIETDLSSQSAEILKGIDVFEQLISGQKAVANARKNVKTNANTPEPIRQKKLQKLEGLATSAKTNLEQALANPETDVNEIPKLKKRSAAANKALDLYKLEIADPAKEIEKLNQKLANGNAVLAKNIQELQARLTQAIPALFRDASQEVVKVGNLGEIAPQKPKSIVQEQKEYYNEGAILQREQGKKKEQEIKRNVANNRSETELPREYREIVKDVASLYAGIKVKSRDIPQLKASGTQQKLGYSGLYDPAKNQVSVSNELFSRAQSGTLAPQDISTLTHEIIHAIDYGFGKKTQIDAADSVRNIQPTKEELRIEGGRIESSTRFEDAEKNHGQSRDLSRTLETNAYIGDLRLSPEVIKRTEKKRAIHNLETEFGRGAPLAVNQYKGINSSVDASYTKVLSSAASSGISMDKEGKDSLARQKLILEKGFSELKPLVDKARSSLHILPTPEIIALQESIRSTLASSMSAIEKEQAALQSELQKKKLVSVEEIPPIKSNHDIWDSPKDELSSTGLDFKTSVNVRKFAASNLNAKGVKDLARRLSIDTRHANKEFLLNEISSAGGTAGGREQIAQKISQLTPDKFLSKSSAKGNANPSSEAPKAIDELKKVRKELANALKTVQELDVLDRRTVLEEIVKIASEQEAIAKQLSGEHQLSPGHSKSLGGVRSQLKNISYQSKVALSEVDQAENPAPIGEGLGANLVSAIGSGMSNAAKKPIKEVQQVMVAIEGAAKNQAEIKSPSKVFEHIGKFIAEGLAIGITQGTKLVEGAIAKVIDQGGKTSLERGKSLLPTPPVPPGFNSPIGKTTPPIPPVLGLPKLGKNKATEKIKSGQEELKRATENFQKIFAEVVKMSGLDPSDRSVKTPSLEMMTGKNLASGAFYSEDLNTITLRPKTIKRLAKGNLSRGDIDNIAHESRHAIQSGFGDNTYTEGKGWDWHSLVPLRKAKNWRQKLNANISQYLFLKSYRKSMEEEPSPKELQTTLETEEDAYAFAAEVTPTLHKNLKNILKVDPEQLERGNQGKISKPLVPPSFNSPIGKSAQLIPPPPPGFNSPIGKPLSLPIPPPPEQVDPRFGVKALVPFERKSLLPVPFKPASFDPKRSKLPVPPPPQVVDPKFGLPIKLQELFNKVIDAGELLKIVSDIQQDQTKNINQKLKEYDKIIKIYDDLEAEKVKQNQALDDKFDPDKVDHQRETIKQRAKLSAKLERKYGMEGLAPEILPNRIKESGEVAPAPSIFQGIKDIFKSLDNSVAKRVKKRAAQLALEVETAIAPSLEGQAIAAQQRGDKVEQKQYQKLARQSRAATKGVARILETPGDLTEKQVKQLDRLTQQLEKVYDAIGRPLPSQGFLESFGLEAGGIVKSLGGVIKGFLAFSIGMWAQNFFGSITQECFKAYVELDRLKTSLNFASGGVAGGAQNLAFVRKAVDDLKIPLKASTEGFTQLAAASRGSALEGKQTRDLFLGIGQASTVLSLSAEDTQGAILALTQIISKGKVSSEELRQQLGERIPGAMGIAARSMGVTEAEFQRLLDTGQLLSQDFLPKFALQLKSEFGDAAKDASGNAQSAIFGVENAFLSLQQGVGEGFAPAATAGLNIFAVGLKGMSSVAKELGFAFLAVSAVLSGNLFFALKGIIGTLIQAKLVSVELGGGMQALGERLNNSASVKWAAGIFAVLEIVNLLNQAINTELVVSFQKAADAAKRSAEETKKFLEKPKPEASGGVERFIDKYAIAPINSATGSKIQTFAERENEQIERGKTQGLDPVATSGVGRFLDKYLVGFLNSDLGPIPGGILGNKITTYGEYERDSTVNNIQERGLSNVENLGDARLLLSQFKTGTGEAGKLRSIDAQSKQTEQERATLQAQIKRDYTDKGLTIPSDSRQKTEALNLKFNQLNDQRAEAGKPLTFILNDTTQKINSIKTQLEQLKDPDKIANLGGQVAADEQRENLQRQLKPQQQLKAELEQALGALRIDPVRAFTQALRELNLALSDSQEKTQLAFEAKKAEISLQQVAGFKNNKFAGKTAGVNLALKEKEKARLDYERQQTISNGLDTEVNRPEFQTTLQRLGVSPDSSAAKIDDVVKNTTDEGDKGILEKLKSSREEKNKLGASRDNYAQSMQKVQSSVQDFHSFKIDEKTADSSAAIQKNENLRIAGIKRSLEAKVILEEVANEEIARSELKTTQAQRKNTNEQLAGARASHAAGFMSAEEFAKRKRDLDTQQTALEKQEAENRLAVQQTVQARHLKDIEFANKKAESAIALSQVASSSGVKSRLLTSGITTSTKENADLDQNSIDQKAAIDNTALVKTKIAQNKQDYKERRQNARQFVEQEMALNLELARSNQQVIDLKIAAEEKYRAIVERKISTNKTIATNAIDKRLLSSGLTPEATDQAAINKNKLDQQEVVDKLKFIKSRVKNEKDAKDEIAALDSQLTKLKIEGEEKYRESFEHSIQRIVQTEENRFRKQQSQLDESKAKLDLYNQSLERTNKLEQSRQSLSKALSNAALAPLENKKADAKDAHALVEKLRDPKITPAEKADIKEQLKKIGYGQQSGLVVTPATVGYGSSGDSPDDYDLQITKDEATTEQKIADIQKKAMDAEQEFQRKSLENDLKRQKIAAQIALYDAQGAQLAAQKSKLEADAALKIAIAKKDPVAIQTAQVGVELANKEIDLSERRMNSAQANANDQPEIAANATLEQKTTQGTETENFQAGETRRKRATALELVEAEQKAGKPISLADAEAKAGASELALPRKIDMSQIQPLTPKPGESLFDAYQRQRDEMKLPSNGVKLPTAKIDIPPMDKTAQAINSSSIRPTDTSSGNQFVEALKMANQGIEQRLDALNSAIITLANTPRSLTVQTPNAVDDAAKLINDMSRGQVMAGGM